MNKKKNGYAPMIGGSSLLVIFAILCLTVFALLSISTVQADDRLSTASAKAMENYYAADLEAQRVLAQLRRGEIAQNVSRSGNEYSYTCPVSDTQAISVRVRMDGDVFEVLQWQLCSTADWTPDDSLTVWDGELF